MKFKDRIAYAYERSQYWLAEYNRHNEETHNQKAAEKAYKKAEFWLWRLNKLEGLA